MTIFQGIAVSLSFDGNTLAVGGSQDNSGIGATWIFTRNGGIWTQQGSKLIANDSIGAAAQGQSVSLSSDGNILAVSGPSDNTNIGATWIFTRDNSGIWTQQGSKIVGTGAAGSAVQGLSVALTPDADFLAVGGPLDNNFFGATWLFAKSGNSYIQQGSKLVGTGASGTPTQGTSVAIADLTVVIGGPTDNTTGAGVVGATWIFAIPLLIPCLHPDTLVKTAKGNKRISDLRKGDIVVDYHGKEIPIVCNLHFNSSGTLY